MSRLKAVNILSCLLPVGMGEEQVGENGIHDVSMRENGAVNGGSSTPNVPADVRGQESERSDSGVAKGGQGLGDSFFFFFGNGEGSVRKRVVVVWENVEKKLGRKTTSYHHDDNGKQRCTWDIGGLLNSTGQLGDTSVKSNG